MDRLPTKTPPSAESVHFSREVMNAKEAADFLRLSPAAFRKLAPTLPRCKIYERGGYRYLREDLLRWLRERTDGNQVGNVAANVGNPHAPERTNMNKRGKREKVTRLV